MPPVNNQIDEELASIDRHFEFVNSGFKNSISEIDSIIQMLRARLAAEEAYMRELFKVKKLAVTETERPAYAEPQNLYQATIRVYEGTVNDLIESRQRHRDTIKLEIDVLVRQKQMEETNRKTYKNKLFDANLNYTTFRNRDITKSNWQQQQQMLAEENNEHHKPSRNSVDLNPIENTSREIDGDQHNKKGMAGLISQMRTLAAANMAPPDQNKQITKFARMKKEIADADSEYRDGILVLETLRKKQVKTAEEQLKNTIKRKTDTVKTSLNNILRSEMESLQMEMNIARTSYNTTSNLDSGKDIQLFDMHYHSQGFVSPSPIRYENYYMEGKCKEVLFGGLLESYALEHNIAVPKIVSSCIEAVEKMGGLQKEGIYRVSGRQSNIETLKHQFELDEDRVQLESFDVFTIATVLKMYVRELKQPLFNFNIQTRTSYSRTMPQNQRFALLESKLAGLSLAHRSTLHCIFRHLSKINANSHINKMNVSNLALIFTPVIFHDFNQTEEGSVSGDWSPEDLFEDLILYCDTLFPHAEEMARRNNEQKLNEALNGKNPYTQFSQSNLLYLSNSTFNYSHPTNNLLLTQPMNPPHLAGGNAESPMMPTEPLNDQQYPPKLTTIIGTVPSQQQSAPVQTHPYRPPFRPTAPPAQQQQQIYSSSDKMLPSIQPTLPKDAPLSRRPLSDMLPNNAPSGTTLSRGSSMVHHRQNDLSEPDYNNSPVPARKPMLTELPRRGSSTVHLTQSKTPSGESLKGLDTFSNPKPSMTEQGPGLSQSQFNTEEVLALKKDEKDRSD
ncbi:hypothetical protein A0J61_04485 [Choanephora cucurbitarum]|uniref:Rho-GAP domain-containing protein n=1 Tax=Choanephora cucurbitarum TaxID=101091 RepID=A0A1C7NFY3_9FUNG|nr:hypothetical protein A0J61_04485 [Choanephora cucurbitarum]